MKCKCGQKLHWEDGAFCIYCMTKEAGYDSLKDRQKIRYLEEKLSGKNVSIVKLNKEIKELKQLIDYIIKTEIIPYNAEQIKEMMLDSKKSIYKQ